MFWESKCVVILSKVLKFYYVRLGLICFVRVEVEVGVISVCCGRDWGSLILGDGGGGLVG